MSDRQATQEDSLEREGASNNDSPSLRVPKWTFKRGMLVFVGLTIILAIAIAIAYALNPSTRLDEKIIIGDTTITQQDVDKYVKQVQQERDTSESVITKDEDGREIDIRSAAIDKLVLNAALKYEAKKYKVALTKADLTGALRGPDGSEITVDVDAYTQQYMRRIHIENEAYQAKLADKLLDKKDLLIARVTFDTPYFNRAPANKIDGYYKDAKKRLNDEILPLMKAGKSKEEIAKVADVVMFQEDNPNNQNWQQYFDKSVLVVDAMDQYLPEHEQAFNDIDVAYNGKPGKLLGTDAKISELKKVGDTTEVFGSKAGMYMVVRLESKTGGKYGSWDGMLMQYKKQYVEGKTSIASLIRANVNSFASTAARYSVNLLNHAVLIVSSIGMEKAAAQLPRDGCSSHNVDFVVRAYNATTGDYLSGAKMTIVRDQPHACGSRYVGTFELTSGSANTFHDNCYGPAPKFNAPFQHPPGYSAANYKGMQWEDNGVYKPGAPSWRPEDINGASGGKIYIRLVYEKNGPTTGNDWALTPKSFVSNSDQGDTNGSNQWGTAGDTVTAKPGDTVYFMHTIKNTGSETTDNFNRRRLLTRFNVAGGNDLWQAVDGVANVKLSSGGTIHTPGTSGGRAFTIPADAGGGTTYCQQVEVGPQSDKTTASETSSAACVRVEYFSLEPLSAVSSAYVELGGGVTYDHHIRNNGTTYNLFWNRTATQFDYTKAWPLFSYNRSNPSDGTNHASASNYIIGPVAEAEDTITIQAGETRLYPWTTLVGSVSTPVTGRSLTVGSDTGTLGKTYCQAYKIDPSYIVGSYGSPAYDIDNPLTSTPACTTVVGGKVGVGTNPSAGSSRYIEPGEASSIDIVVSDANFWKGTTAWSGYSVDCDYTVTVYAPPPSTASTETKVAGGCNTSITAINDPKTFKYTYTGSSTIGEQVCVKATINSAAGPSGTPNASLLSASTTSGSTCIDVIARPYLKVYGSDVSVGGGVGTCDDSDSIVSWNKGSTSYGGAGAQFAVLARGKLFGFTGAQGNASDPKYAAKPLGLNFSNVDLVTKVAIANPVTDSNYGGGFRGACGATKDYYAKVKDVPNTQTWPGFAGATATPSPAAKKYKIDTGLDLSAATIPNENNVILYVNGDLNIKGNINAAPTGPDSVLKTPMFMVVVNGDIFVDGSVSSLYGTYIAQPKSDTVGGKIYTCANTGVVPSVQRSSMIQAGATNPDYALCNSKLTVTGSFVAKQVFFGRTFGSQYEATGDNNNDRAKAAEVFQYNPLIWVRQNSTSGGSGDLKLDSVTNLPPVL